ncbi:MAG: CoA-binding protein [Polaromonas sp.]|nr:CoA-binding protein [Polaromonas sp.]
MPNAGEADTATAILQRCRTIAVVGLSPDPSRVSFAVSRYMQAAGYRIVPVNPKAASVLGERCYASLSAAALHETIDLVNCFRRSEEIGAIADETLALGLPALWMQLGVVNDAAADKLRAAGVQVVQDRCLKIQHRLARARGLL